MPEITEQNDLTAELERLWMEVLGVDSVDEQDDFFDLGGHSLSALRLSTLIRYELELPVLLPQVLANPRYADLREAVQQAARDRLADAVAEA